MPELDPWEEQLAQSWPPERWMGAGVVLAVSGGADSVALLRGMAALCGNERSPLRVAHLNHALRGAESDGDQQLVEHLCQELDLPCHIRRADTAKEAERMGTSVEAAGRALRYAFFQELAEQHAAGYVATAHTADDQVETILHRILRGTGLAGLGGIPRTRSLGPAVTLLRPMLTFRRDDNVAYLARLGQAFRIDASNADSQYTRNRIRHILLPLLRQDFNPGIDDAIAKLGGLASDVQRIIVPQVTRLRETSVRLGPSQVCIDCSALREAEPYLIRELLLAEWTNQGWPLRSMGYREWELLRRMVQDQAAEKVCILPGGISARRDASTLTLSPI